MSLKDYEVKNDHFEEPADSSEFDFYFPCCVCRHRHGKETDEPCNSCGHNMNAVLADTFNPSHHAETRFGGDSVHGVVRQEESK